MKSTYRNAWLLPLIFMGLGLLPSVWLVAIADQPWQYVWKDAVADASYLGLGSLATIRLIRSYPTKVGMITYAVICGVVIGVVISIADVELLKFFHSRANPFMQQWLRDTIILRYAISTGLFTSFAVIMAAERRVKALQERFRRQQDAESLLKEAELLKLRQQLQPHFLFNSLNSISSLILISPDKAQNMTGQLADFLRMSVRQDGKEAVPVEDELSYIEAYLNIEGVRFGDRLHIDIKRNNIEDMRMPSHLLQPLVENAVKYGLQCEGRNITITIQLDGAPGMMTITITNPRTTMALAPKGTGFGLEGVHRRLYLLYARTDLLETISTDTQFTTILKIPQVHVSLPHY